MELDVGELEHPVDGEEHVQLAIRMTQLAAVDMDITDGGWGEPARFSTCSPGGRRDMPWRCRHRCNALRLRFGIVSRKPGTSSSGNRVRRRNSTIMASSIGVRTVLCGSVGPIRASVVVMRRRHLATVFGFSPYCSARARVLACDAWSSAEHAASFGRCHEELLPKCILLLPTQE